MAKEFVSLARLSEVITALKERMTNKVSKSGDTMSGDLKVGSSMIQTNGYITGTWFKATANLASANASNLWCILKDGWIYTRTTEQVKLDLGIPEKVLVLESTVTLGTNWSGASPPFSQAVTVSGLLSTDKPILDVQVSLSDYENQEIEWSKIVKAESENNKLTFYAKSKTAKSLTIKIKVVR